MTLRSGRVYFEWESYWRRCNPRRRARGSAEGARKPARRAVNLAVMTGESLVIRELRARRYAAPCVVSEGRRPRSSKGRLRRRCRPRVPFVYRSASDLGAAPPTRFGKRCAKTIRFTLNEARGAPESNRVKPRRTRPSPFRPALESFIECFRGPSAGIRRANTRPTATVSIRGERRQRKHGGERAALPSMRPGAGGRSGRCRLAGSADAGCVRTPR